MFRNTTPSRSGFTLIELLVVIVIIGVLATLAVVALSSARAKSRDARRVSDLKQISTALELYMADENVYPGLITAGQPMVGATSGKTYMSKVPADPSTNTGYAYGSSDSKFTLRTTIENTVNDIPTGPVIVTNSGGVKQATNVDSRYMDSDLTFGGTLVGHWALDGNTGTRDLAGSNNNGVLSGDGVTSTGRFGEVNGAYYLNVTTTSYLSIVPANKAVLQPANITISAWAYNPNTNMTYLMMHGEPVNRATSGYYFSNKILALLLSTGISLGTAITPPSNTWYMITGAYDGSSIKMYLNGSLQSTVATTGNIIYNVGRGVDNFEIGRYPYALSVAMSRQDRMADLRIYNKALLPEEITQLYNATKP